MSYCGDHSNMVAPLDYTWPFHQAISSNICSYLGHFQSQAWKMKEIHSAKIIIFSKKKLFLYFDKMELLYLRKWNFYTTKKLNKTFFKLLASKNASLSTFLIYRTPCHARGHHFHFPPNLYLGKKSIYLGVASILKDVLLHTFLAFLQPV